jgi:flagellar hook assembly protein FlgD
VSFRIASDDATPVRIHVVDASGRVVRRAELPGGVAGERSWTWDGADDDGRVMAAGYYRVRAFGRTGGMSQPVVRIP